MGFVAQDDGQGSGTEIANSRPLDRQRARTTNSRGWGNDNLVVKGKKDNKIK